MKSIQGREKHVVNMAEQFNNFLRIHLREADEAKKDGRRHWMCVDVENTTSRGFSWHERWLRKEGETEESIEARRRNTQELRGQSERKRIHNMVARYWINRQEEREDAIVKGDVAAISLSAIDDTEGTATVAAHCINIVNHSFNGQPQMPDSFRHLLTHKAVYWVIVAIYNDMDDIIRSFNASSLQSIKFVIAEDFFIAAWGTAWNGAKSTKGAHHQSNRLESLSGEDDVEAS